MGVPLTVSSTRTTGLRWLALVFLAYGVLHHAGSGLAFLGSVGQTRWADWVELFTPHAVLLPAGAALYAVGATRLVWFVYVVGAVTYAVGSGVHLAANSIANIAPGPTAHLWDETVGHHVWYAGTALVFVALAAAFAGFDRPRGLAVPAAYGLALLAGVTHTTNSLEGGTVLLGCGVAAMFSIWGWMTRDRLGQLLLVAYLPALVMIAAYGFGLQ